MNIACLTLTYLAKHLEQTEIKIGLTSTVAMARMQNR